MPGGYEPGDTVSSSMNEAELDQGWERQHP